MRKLIPILTAAGMVVALGQAQAAKAQISLLPRADIGSVGVAIVREEGCIVSARRGSIGDYEKTPGEGAGGVAGVFLANLGGDAIAAGADVIGAALEEASKARGFALTGYTSFNFYRFETPPPPPAANADGSRAEPAAALVPVMPTQGGACLILALPATEGGATAGLFIDEAGIPGDVQETWRAAGLPTSPGVYVEAELQVRPDGFRVRPVLVWYGQSLPSAPRRGAHSAEMHVSFAVPAAPSQSGLIGETFAVARMPLPPLEPGSRFFGPQLLPYASTVMPLRPDAGSARTAVDALNTLVLNLATREEDLLTTTRALRAARVDAAAPEAKAADRALVVTLVDQENDLKLEIAELRDSIGRQRAVVAPRRYGSTNVEARLVVIRDANAFGVALASALRRRSAELATSAGTAMRPWVSGNDWSSERTAYVIARNAADDCQAAYNRALAGGDPEAIRLARAALLQAQTHANETAQAARQSLPYPGLLR